MAELIVTLKGRELRRVPIVRTDTAIGRDACAEVQIENVGVSRVHAVVRYRDGAFRVHDHGSSNGISVNGKLRTVHDLRDGDEIQVGKFIVRFAAHTGPRSPTEDNRARTDLDAIKEVSLADKTTALSPLELEKLSLLPHAAPAPDLDDDTTSPGLARERRETLLIVSLVVALVVVAILAVALILR